jgi:soluble lytic murein transglycosylase-like protein
MKKGQKKELKFLLFSTCLLATFFLNQGVVLQKERIDSQKNQAPSPSNLAESQQSLPSSQSLIMENTIVSATVTPAPTITPVKGAPESLEAENTVPIPSVTPAPTQNPETSNQTTVDISQENLNELFEKYGNEYGVNEQTLSKIARCESTFNPRAINGPFAGLFQFTAETWASTRKLLNLDPNPELRFNPEEAIKTASFKIANDGTGAWPVCGR